MSVRKRKWTTRSDEEREAWIVDYTDASDVRRIESFARKKPADARHDEVRQSVRHGTHFSPKITVAEAGKAWADKAEQGVGREDGPLEKATIKGYRDNLRLHIVPLIGKMAVAKIDKIAVDPFEEELLEGRSRQTVKRVLSCLSAILSDCGAPRNAVRNRPRYKKGGRDEDGLKIGTDIPTPEQISALLFHAPKRWRPLLLLAAFTGLRASELRGLRWEDVHLKKRTIKVTQRADRYGTIGSPKSKTSRREVPFGSSVANVLTPFYVKAGGKGIAFPTREGTIVDHANLVRSSIIPAAKAAGLPYTGLHCLRHFYASWCLNRKEEVALGFSFHQVKELMGHASITITVDTYGHLFKKGDPGVLDDAEARLMGLHATRLQHD